MRRFKQKKEKIGYSPKNLKKKLLSYSPVFSSAIKSISVAVSAQLQSVGDILDTKKISSIELSKKKENKKKRERGRNGEKNVVQHYRSKTKYEQGGSGNSRRVRSITARKASSKLDGRLCRSWSTK